MKGGKHAGKSARKRLVGLVRLKQKKRPVDHGQLEPKKRPVDHAQLESQKRPANARINRLTEGEKLQRSRDYAVHFRSPWELETPCINDAVYGKVTKDASVDQLVESIKRRGVITPLLVNRKGVVISGNRRCVAACRAGLHEVPCYVWDVPESSDDFARILVEANECRVKDGSVQTAEIGIKGTNGDPVMWLAARRIEAERRARCGGMAEALEVKGRTRKPITRARKLADAAIEAVHEELAQGITPTVRQIHYRLLDAAPVKDTQTGERYKNDDASYRALVSVMARLRVNGEIPFDHVIDAGRELFMQQTHADAADYVRDTLAGFGGTYRRNYMRSQGAFFAVIVEKAAMIEFFRQHVCEKYPGAAVMACRGFASLSLVYELYSAFKASGKAHMVILAFSDCDPAGGGIVENVGQTLLELGLDECEFALARCGLTHAQAQTFGARPQPIKAKGKAGKTVARKFEEKHGTRDVYEMEAIPPGELLKILDDEMLARMNLDAYNAEVEADERDAETIVETRRRLYAALVPGGVKGEKR